MLNSHVEIYRAVASLQREPLSCLQIPRSSHHFLNLSLRYNHQSSTLPRDPAFRNHKKKAFFNNTFLVLLNSNTLLLTFPLILEFRTKKPRGTSFFLLSKFRVLSLGTSHLILSLSLRSLLFTFLWTSCGSRFTRPCQP